MQFSPRSVFLPFMYKYPPQHSLLKNLQTLFLPQCERPRQSNTSTFLKVGTVINAFYCCFNTSNKVIEFCVSRTWMASASTCWYIAWRKEGSLNKSCYRDVLQHATSFRSHFCNKQITPLNMEPQCIMRTDVQTFVSCLCDVIVLTQTERILPRSHIF
jgi:hypothetical protein